MILTHGMPLMIPAPGNSKLTLALCLKFPPLPERKTTLTLDLVGANPKYEFDLDFRVAWIQATLDCKLQDGVLWMELKVDDEDPLVQQAVTLRWEGA